jgi:hypothetical protein
MDVNLTQQIVSYRVADRYPADATITSLSDAMTRRQCAASEKDPFNPEPGLPFNRWTERTPEEGAASTLSWAGAWICQPDGDVVVFGFQTTREAARQPANAIEVKGAYYSAAQLRALRQETGVAGGGAGLSSFGAARTGRHQTSLQTCAICGATRKMVNDGPWKILYAGRSATTHEHNWEGGVSSGTAAIDDRVVLVRLRLKLDDPTYAYGAFILQSERGTPREQTDYTWVFRTDGGSLFDLTQHSVSQGIVKDQGQVSFGPFRVPWSGSGAGKGFLYYPRVPGSGRSSDDFELCLTDLASFSGVDAADPRFIYQTSPVD